MRAVVCMVTAPVTCQADHDRLVERIQAAARAGTHLIQIRQLQLEALAITRLVEGALQAINGTTARILVNDRVDVAMAAGAHGVHLRGDSMPAHRVRAMAPPGFVIGRSVHSVGEAVAAEREGGLDYLLFGTVFPTSSKAGVQPSGVDALAKVCAAVSLPVLAIGGITASASGAVARAGAAGFGAIGLFVNGPVETLLDTVQRASSAFDTPRSVP